MVLSMEVVDGLCLFFVVVGSSVSSTRVDSVREAEAGGLLGFGARESMELSLVLVAERGETRGEEVVDSLRVWPWGE